MAAASCLATQSALRQPTQTDGCTRTRRARRIVYDDVSTEEIRRHRHATVFRPLVHARRAHAIETIEGSKRTCQQTTRKTIVFRLQREFRNRDHVTVQTAHETRRLQRTVVSAFSRDYFANLTALYGYEASHPRRIPAIRTRYCCGSMSKYLCPLVTRVSSETDTINKEQF